MPTLLRVDSSPMFQNPVSRQLTEEFVQKWKVLHPAGGTAGLRSPIADRIAFLQPFVEAVSAQVV